MNNHDLLTAIGHVPEEYLPELEACHVRRLPKRFGLIAAAVALLLTACAGPALAQHFDALQSGSIINNESVRTWDELWENPDAHWMEGDYIILRPGTVCIDVAVAENAPKILEKPCLPLALLEYTSTEAGSLSETSLSMEFSMKVPRHGMVRGIFYQQHILPEDGHIELDDFVDFGIMKEQMKTYGSISVLEIEGDTCYPLLDDPRVQPAIFTKHLFWSDGYYLYCLKLPITYNLPVSAVEEIIISLAAVDDISRYISAE